MLLHQVADLAVLPANILATIIAVVHNFLWHNFVTFRDHGQMTAVVFGKFMLISLAGIALNSFVVLAGISLGLFPAAAKLIAILLVTVWNYLLNSRVTFRV